MATCFSAPAGGRRVWLLAAMCLGMGTFCAWGQQDQGVDVIKEGGINTQSSVGDLILEPFRVSALLGYAAVGNPWMEFSAGAGLWWGNLRLAADAHVRGETLTLATDVESQFEHLSLFAGARLTNTNNPVQLSAGVRTRIEPFNLSARVAVDNGLSFQANAATRLDAVEAFVGAGLTQGAPNFTAGVNLPSDPMTLSAAVSFGGAGLDVSGGADLALAEPFSLYANAGWGGGELRASAGARLNTALLKLNALGLWGSGTGLGAIVHGEVGVDTLSVFGTLRMDADSLSADVGGKLALDSLDTALTVGLDQQGFKWAQLQITAEFGGTS